MFVRPAAIAALLLASICDAKTAMKHMDSVKRSVLADSGWQDTRTIERKDGLTLQIGLTLQNVDQMIAKLLDVSDPRSKNYGQWMDRDAVNQLVQPSAVASKAVMEWLSVENVTDVHSDGTWVTFTTDVETANRILDADFRKYHNDGVQKIRTTSYSVPLILSEHIELIHPTTFFGKTEAFAPAPKPAQQEWTQLDARQLSPTIPTNAPSDVSQRPAPGSMTGAGPFQVNPDCMRGITPACIRQMYNIGNYQVGPNTRSRMAFSSFLNQSANYLDLSLYQQYYRLPQQKLTKIFVNKAADDQNPAVAKDRAGEANLDAQSMVGTATGVPLFEYLTGGSPPFIADLEMASESKNTNEPYVPYYQFLLSKKNSELPQVISNSYGEPEQTVPKAYAQRACTMIAMMGLRGITVLESSGDTGIGSHCKKNDGTGTPTFLPQFPGTCPWITAIGGTEGVSPEIAWRDSSGGFSNYFEQPEYQRPHVEAYLKTGLNQALAASFKPYFNAQGRGFPDVSAHSLHPAYRIVFGGALGGSGGTSAAAPVIAGIVALLNDARLKANLPTLGFLNPWLYQSGKTFLVDTIGGGARGCDGTNYQTGQRTGGAALIPGAVWNATAGWDAATGLGVFDFQKALRSALGNRGSLRLPVAVPGPVPMPVPVPVLVPRPVPGQRAPGGRIG